MTVIIIGAGTIGACLAEYLFGAGMDMSRIALAGAMAEIRCASVTRCCCSAASLP